MADEVTAMLDTMLHDLEALVVVESPSGAGAALLRSAHAVSDLCVRRLGRPPELVEGAVGPHVHWRGGGAPRVLVVGHHDTVFPIGTLAQRPFAVEAGRVTGPGVFDMKAGIVQAVHAIAALDDASGVELLLTSDEEVGSRSSRSLLEERARACGAVLVLEPSADGGALKTGRKGTGTYEVAITGRAAHAGLEPEKGVNALIEAAQQVLDIADFGFPEIGTTVTPTLASSGTADNVVPAAARVLVDVRVLRPGEAQRVDDLMHTLVPRHPEATITVSGGLNRPPMDEGSSAELFAVAREVAASVGLAGLEGRVVGGGSDGNFTAAIGVPTLDGLGAVGGGAHADTEHVLVDSMPERVALLSALLARLVSR